MKCRETQYWLYSFQPNAAWPAEVVGHLQECQVCQQLQAHLRQIDQQVNVLTSLPANSGPKEHLLERIGKTPQTPVAPQSAKPRRGLPSLRWGAYLSGAAALIALGFLLGRQGETLGTPEETIKTVEVVREKTVEIFRDKLVQVPSQAERNLFAMLLKRNARLVQSSQARDRLETLLDMADDCRQHALTLIEHGPRDYLPLTIGLYAQLLKEGVLGQLAQTPPEDRPLLEAAARIRLRKMAEPMPGDGTAPKILQEQGETLQTIARETMEQTSQPQRGSGPTKSGDRNEPVAPTLALVQFAIAYSSEADHVAKADRCSDCVQRLMPYMMLYLAEDSAPQRGEMGQQFGEMIQFGVYTPLAKATVQESAQPVKDQVERVFKNAEQAVAQMEKNLQQAPTAVRPALERALEATKKGWEKNKGKAKGKNKGKGPPRKQSAIDTWESRNPLAHDGTLALPPRSPAIRLDCHASFRETFVLSRRLDAIRL